MSTLPFNNPFPSTSADPCESSACSGTNSSLICGFDGSCPPGSGCESLFGDIKFLNGYVVGFNSRLGFGGSESTVGVDLVFAKNICMPSPSVDANPNPSASPCVLETCQDMASYDGRLGYLYTFSLGNFCFRGILTNHNYSEGNDGYKYRLTLTDGRNILNNTTIILNSIYDRPPSELQFNVLNALYFLEPSVDDCDGTNKCDDFMKSGANKKGIFLKRALQQLNKKQIQVPISKICLTLNFDKLINIIPPTYRSTTTEMSLLDLVTLVCDESGYDFFCQINNSNEIEIIPVNYKKSVTDKPLLQFLDDLDASNDIVISREYGEEMTFEKNKRMVFGDNYHYLTTIEEPEPNVNNACTLTSPNVNECKIINPPFSKLVTRDTDDPIKASNDPEPSCS